MVTTEDGKEILIPFVEQIVPEVNVGEKYVLVTPPPGLFEVNTDDAAASRPQNRQRRAADAKQADQQGPEGTERTEGTAGSNA